jgi:hypothetical protein
MVQPINYILDVKTPFEAAAEGFNLGAAGEAARVKREDRERAIAQQALAQQQLAELNAERARVFSNPNASLQDYEALASRLPKDQAEVILQVSQRMGERKLNEQRTIGGQVYAAINSGNTPVAMEILRKESEAAKNSGQNDVAQGWDTWSKLIEINPTNAKGTIGELLASLPGSKDQLASAIAASKAPSEIRTLQAGATQQEVIARNTPQRLDLENRQTAANIRNIDDQIRDRTNRFNLDSSRLRLDQDRLQSDVEARLYESNQKLTTVLDATGVKIVNDAAVAASSAQQSAGRMLDLADQLSKQPRFSGAAASVSEWLKQTTGNQDVVSQLRTEYTRLRNSQAIKSLPPGVATDKDIELALKGIPPETANPATLASFLRGMAKMSQIEAVTEEAKADWVSSNGSLGRARSDIDIGGIQVPRGTSYPEFLRQYQGQQADALAANRATNTVAGRSYMRFGQ